MEKLSEFSLPELRKLRTRVENEISKREQSSKADLLKQLKKLAKDEGVQLEDLLGMKSPKQTEVKPARRGKKAAASTKPAKKKPIPVKYRNPNKLDEAWSGRGRKPAWFAAWVNNGGSITALENAASFEQTRHPAHPEADESPRVS